MSDISKFNAALPAPYSNNWREAERSENESTPRLTSYQAPGAGVIIFILDNFSFKGGQSVDTAEYPFNGLWSNERLNEKTQTLAIQGFIRGADYIKIRNALIESFRIQTSDEAPGFIDLPFWGRFPVVVIDYEISEKPNEKGQCAVSLEFRRAGVSLEDRASIPNVGETIGSAVKKFENAAILDFEKKLKSGFDMQTLMAGFGKIKAVLAGAVGRIRAAETFINVMTAEINGITSLIAQGISAPGQLARAQFNAVSSIVAGLYEIKAAAESYMSSGGDDGASASSGGSAGASLYPVPTHNNEKNVLLSFYSASDYAMDVPAATTQQQETKSAMENLYRAGALCAANQIILQMEMPYQKMSGHWALLSKLEESVDKNDSSVFISIRDMRIAVSRGLLKKELSRENIKIFDAPTPLLFIAHYLGCDENKLRELNQIADSFSIEGGVVYV